jgi:hypothetical protein
MESLFLSFPRLTVDNWKNYLQRHSVLAPRRREDSTTLMTLTTSWKLLACLFPGPREKDEAEINPKQADSWINLMQVASLGETWKALELPST